MKNTMTIKQLRTLSGMTQKRFGEFFGIPWRTLQDWEGEKRKPPDYIAPLLQYKLEQEGIIKK